MPTSPFASLEASFSLLCKGPAPLALDGRLVEGLPERLIPLDELRAILLHPSTGYDTRDAALGLLLARAKAERGGALVGLASVLLPRLRTAAWRLGCAFPGGAADLESEMLVGLLLAIDKAEPGRARLAARLTWAARRHAKRALRRELAERARPSGDPLPAEPPRPYGHPDFVLGRLVRDGVLLGDDAELIAATRLSGEPLAGAAARLGLSYAAAEKRRWRAECRVAEALAPGEGPDRFVGARAARCRSSVGGRPRQDRVSDGPAGMRQPQVDHDQRR
jgi:hypothetical protein